MALGAVPASDSSEASGGVCLRCDSRSDFAAYHRLGGSPQSTYDGFARFERGGNVRVNKRQQGKRGIRTCFNGIVVESLFVVVQDMIDLTCRFIRFRLLRPDLVRCRVRRWHAGAKGGVHASRFGDNLFNLAHGTRDL